MRKKRFSNILPFLLVLGLVAATSASTSSTNYSLKASVLSSGGKTMDSASYQMTTTIGQPSCIGESFSNSYMAYAGFWQSDSSDDYAFTIDPIQGTFGTEITITGENLGVKKGKVAIGSMKCKVLEWTDTAISGLIKKVPTTMGPGTYDVTITPKGKGLAPMVMEDAFSIMTPSINTINPVSGSPKDEVTITGSFFGTKKVKASMGDGIGKSKKGKVVSLTMNPNTGASTLEILVPKKLAPGLYNVTVTNKVGEDTLVGGFTIQ